MSKKIYIAGPMTGIYKHNYPKFFEVEEKLRAEGWDVSNPARIATLMFGGDPGIKGVTALELKRLMKLEFEHLATCDYIYLLKGWETSTGAKKELQVALALGLEVICE